MKTTLCIHLHERAIKYLEGIQRCNRHIDASQECLNKRNSWVNLTYDYHMQQIEKYTAIKERLLRSYADTIERLIKPVLEATITKIEIQKIAI